MSKSDEESLFKLMHECDFASMSSDNFIEKLQTELVQLDTVTLTQTTTNPYLSNWMILRISFVCHCQVEHREHNELGEEYA